MNRLSRATALKSAAVLSFLFGVYGLTFTLPYLTRGAAAVNAIEGPSYSSIVVFFVFAIVNIVSAYGVWHNQRWGILLTILTHSLDAIAAAPGLLFAVPAAIIGVTLDVLVIVLCLWRDRKPAIV